MEVLPVGIATWFLVRRFVEDPPYLSRLKAAGVKLKLHWHRFAGLRYRGVAGSARQGAGG